MRVRVAHVDTPQRAGFAALVWVAVRCERCGATEQSASTGACAFCAAPLPEVPAETLWSSGFFRAGFRFQTPDELDARMYEAMAAGQKAVRSGRRDLHQAAMRDYFAILPGTQLVKVPIWAGTSQEAFNRWASLGERFMWIQGHLEPMPLSLSGDDGQPIQGNDPAENSRAGARLLEDTRRYVARLVETGARLQVPIADADARTCVQDMFRTLLRGESLRLAQGEPLRLLQELMGDAQDARKRCYHCGAPEITVEGEDPRSARCPWCRALRTRAYHPQTSFLIEMAEGLTERGDDEQGIVSAVATNWLMSSAAARAEMPALEEILTRALPWISVTAIQTVAGVLPHMSFAGSTDAAARLQRLAGTWSPRGTRPPRRSVTRPQDLESALADPWVRKSAAILTMMEAPPDPLKAAVEYAVGSTWGSDPVSAAQVAALVVIFAGRDAAQQFASNPRRFHTPMREGFVDAAARLLT
ncbi:MAG: hypothetical protein AAGE52_14550 [Myxococcota bacterium]